eukprot:scaffold2207_cov95-Cylindrotheca_fusiformis.AAC.2
MHTRPNPYRASSPVRRGIFGSASPRSGGLPQHHHRQSGSSGVGGKTKYIFTIILGSIFIFSYQYSSFSTYDVAYPTSGRTTGTTEPVAPEKEEEEAEAGSVASSTDEIKDEDMGPSEFELAPTAAGDSFDEYEAWRPSQDSEDYKTKASGSSTDSTDNVDDGDNSTATEELTDDVGGNNNTATEESTDGTGVVDEGGNNNASEAPIDGAGVIDEGGNSNATEAPIDGAGVLDEGGNNNATEAPVDGAGV